MLKSFLKELKSTNLSNAFKKRRNDTGSLPQDVFSCIFHHFALKPFKALLFAAPSNNKLIMIDRYNGWWTKQILIGW